jgi:hypothetical protein
VAVVTLASPLRSSYERRTIEEAELSVASVVA